MNCYILYWDCTSSASGPRVDSGRPHSAHGRQNAVQTGEFRNKLTTRSNSRDDSPALAGGIFDVCTIECAAEALLLLYVSL